jgi:hypothetical protein|tara:strand:+ start:483 stop:602 length:120 start_codon:yes stop_codon:yes gene_type:complete
MAIEAKLFEDETENIIDTFNRGMNLGKTGHFDEAISSLT